MAKDRFSFNTKNQHSTPSFAPNTLNAIQNTHFSMLDDEEGDICPVCDGECTCNNKPRVPPPGPLSMAQLQALHLSSPPPPPPPAQKLPKPSLKIKLTVPQSLLGKRQTSKLTKQSDTANHLPNDHLIAADSSDGDSASEKLGSHLQSTSFTPPAHHYPRHQKLLPPSKSRKPRPSTKHASNAVIPTSRQLSLAQTTPRSTPPLTGASAHVRGAFQTQTQKKRLTSTSKKQQKKQIPPRRLPASLVKKKAAAAAAKRRRLACSGDSSPLSDVDHRFGISEDEESGHFPTFVSASILSSRASSSSASDDDDDDDDLSSLSSFSDSSIEAEEENFIRSEVKHDRARVKRELFGDEGLRKRDSSWIIQPRKKSVGLSDAEMDVDSDATEDDDEAHGQLANADDECEEDEEETDGQRRRYIGFGTGWSDDEDEESSFDAELFFAHLSGSGSDGSSSSSDHGNDDDDGDDGDQSDMESMEASITSLNAPNFELMEGWDGQITFTNGLRDGQGILDMDFETRAAQYTETSPPATQDIEIASSDVEMTCAADDEDDDGGYERDTGEGEGDTTDEELVGEDDLPNERAMRLFNLPLSVSSINPMSTMSPVAGPGTRGRRQSLSVNHHSKTLESPKPADILSGKIFWDDSDDFDDFEDTAVRSRSLSSAGRGGPRKGNFEVIGETRQVVIDDSHKDIPSPHPRFRRRRISSLVQFNSIEHVLQQHARTIAHHSPSVSISSQASIATLPSASEEIESEVPGAEHAELVDLNELLEASFMAPDPSSDSPSTSTENESRKAARTFNRWDVVSVGAFRQSVESGSGMGDVTVTPGGWASDTTGSKHSTDYGSMMKSSPLSAMLWNNKTNRAQNRSRRPHIVISPILLPMKDGDRTPTHVPHQHQQQHTPPNQNHNYPHKTRKELKKERKLKRKNFGNHPPHYHHHNHHHHPNSKTRGSSSMQRNSSFTSIPPLSI